jgi:preprotein translocase subunit SecF
MIRLLYGTSYDFIRWWRYGAGLTVAFLAIGISLLFIRGANYSIEFTGGTLVHAEFREAPNVTDIRTTLAANPQIGRAEIQQFGSPTEFTIRAQDPEVVEGQAAGAEHVSRDIENALRERFGADNVTIIRAEAVGPRVGAELRRDALIAILISFAITLIYLAIRFEWRFGLAAIVATAHDMLGAIAFIELMNLEISLIVVAALLTVLGYSMNDTIVIFDRVRENLRKARNEPLYDTLNRSVNETLPRTVITGLTTMASLLALLIFGGAVIRPFAWVLLFGIVIGTFSSIFIAAPVLLWIERKWPRPTSVRGKHASEPAPRARGGGARPVATR